jgi:hypothetical protein
MNVLNLITGNLYIIKELPLNSKSDVPPFFLMIINSGKKTWKYRFLGVFF